VAAVQDMMWPLRETLSSFAVAWCSRACEKTCPRRVLFLFSLLSYYIGGLIEGLYDRLFDEVLSSWRRR
jgi:hypothetical protein